MVPLPLVKQCFGLQKLLLLPLQKPSVSACSLPFDDVNIDPRLCMGSLDRAVSEKDRSDVDTSDPDVLLFKHWRIQMNFQTMTFLMPLICFRGVLSCNSVSGHQEA